jgi:hypothetical protein
MTTRGSNLMLSIFFLLGVASGCTSDPLTPKSAPGVPLQSPSQSQSRVQSDLAQDADRVQACLLGTSCMALESKPFEFCLLGSDKCPAEREVMEVVESKPDSAPEARAQPNKSLERTRGE